MTYKSNVLLINWSNDWMRAWSCSLLCCQRFHSIQLPSFLLSLPLNVRLSSSSTSSAVFTSTNVLLLFLNAACYHLSNGGIKGDTDKGKPLRNKNMKCVISSKCCSSRRRDWKGLMLPVTHHPCEWDGVSVDWLPTVMLPAAQPPALQQSGRCLLFLQDGANIHLKQIHTSILLRNIPDPSEMDWNSDNRQELDEQSANSKCLTLWLWLLGRSQHQGGSQG